MSKSILNKLIIILISVLGLGGLFLLFSYRVTIKQSFEDWNRVRKLPVAIQVETKTLEHLSTGTPKQSLPTEINLKVPFVLQAPFAVWDALHEDACEEASMIMLSAFYEKKADFTKQEMEDGLQKVVAWEKQKFGFFEDTTVDQTVTVLQEYFGLASVKAVFDITVGDIKKEVATGRPVVVPAAGRLLFNPNFRGGGPAYHMILIKGYTKDGYFITNDPGTKRGADYIYKIEVLYKAIHDWVPSGNVLDGRKAMIVVR